MASYQQTIELVVRGEEQLKKLQNRVTALNKEVNKLKDPTTKAGTGVLADISKQATVEQKKYNNEVGRTLLNQIKLNSAVDLYQRRLKAVYTTAAPKQKQFQGRLAEISQAFNVFKDQKNVQGVQAVATELGRITEHSNEIKRAEVARVKSAQRLQGYIKEINRLKAAGVNVSKAEKALEKLKADLGTNRFRQAGALEVRFKQRLKILRQEEQQLKRIRNEEAKRTKARASRLQGAALGAGFPMLFGGGPGQIAGGLLGSLSDVGEEGFGGQILGAALGQQLEDAVRRISEIGNALDALDMDALRDSVVYVNADLETTVRRLIESGDALGAQKVAAEEVANQLGLAPGKVQSINESVNRLNNTWNELVAVTSAYLADYIEPIIDAFTFLGKLATDLLKLNNQIGPSFGSWHEYLNPILGPLKFAHDLLKEQLKDTNSTTEATEERVAALTAGNDKLAREYSSSKQIFDLESQRVVERSIADKEHNAMVDHKIRQEKIAQEFAEKERLARIETAGLTGEEVQKRFTLLTQAKDLKLAEADRANKLKLQSLEMERQKQLREEAIKDIQLQTSLISDQTQSLNYQGQITANIANLNNARRQTESDLLDLQIGRLERQKDEAKHFLDKIKLNNIIIDKRKEQAKLEYESQLTSIKLSVSKAKQERIQIRLKEQQIKLQLEQVRLEAEAIQDAERRNAALNRINKQEKSTLQVVKDMNRAADHSLETTRKIAAFQEQSAEYAYQGKIEALETARAQERMAIFLNSQQGSMNSLASQSGTYASNMERAANAASRPIKKDGTFEERFGLGRTETVTVTTDGPIDTDIQEKVQGRGNWKSVEAMVSEMNRLQAERNKTKAAQARAYAKGGYVTGPHVGMVGEAGPEYIIPERKAAAFATNYLMGARGAGAIPRYAEGGYVGPVNIQTGPVMQQGGTNYVTMAQFEKGLMDLATAVSASNRSYGARQYLGVQR